MPISMRRKRSEEAQPEAGPHAPRPLDRIPAIVLPVVLGNICGGVGLVTILEYGQVIYDHEGQQSKG